VDAHLRAAVELRERRTYLKTLVDNLALNSVVLGGFSMGTVERVTVDEDHRLAGAVVFVVEVDVGIVFAADGKLCHARIVGASRARSNEALVLKAIDYLALPG
jgi:hypothetical protein